MGYLAAAVQRMQVLLVGPGMVALDIDTELRELFGSVLEALEQLPKLQSEKVVPIALDLSVCFHIPPFLLNLLSICLVAQDFCPYF